MIKKHIVNFIAVITVFTFLSGCAMHKVEVQQGNVIAKHVSSYLKPGMTKKQIINLLGTPLLHDSFQDNRWDYYFYFRNKRGKVTQHSFILFFTNDILSKVIR